MQSGAKIRQESGGKGMEERERGVGSPKSRGWGAFWMRISSRALGWTPSHLPLILALAFDMWLLSPLSLALVLAL